MDQEPYIGLEFLAKKDLELFWTIGAGALASC